MCDINVLVVYAVNDGWRDEVLDAKNKGFDLLKETFPEENVTYKDYQIDTDGFENLFIAVKDNLEEDIKNKIDTTARMICDWYVDQTFPIEYAKVSTHLNVADVNKVKSYIDSDNFVKICGILGLDTSYIRFEKV